MVKLDELTMHRDNRLDKSDDLMWLDDIECWRADQERASSMLAAIQAACGEAHAALESHARAVRDHDDCLRRHEQAIRDYQWGDSSAGYAALQAEHERLKAEHVRAQNAHEQLKKHHQRVMAEIRELCKSALGGAVVPEWTS
jgi:chromosome segregation ATPase